MFAHLTNPDPARWHETDYLLSERGSGSCFRNVTNGGNENMKTKRIGILLSALLLAAIAIVPCVSAYQASSYGAIYTGGLDSRITAQTAESKLSSMGYSGTYHWNDAANSALRRMPSDQAFFFVGHGGPGFINYEQSGVTTSLTANNPGLARISSLNPNDLKDMALAVFMGCDTSDYDSTNGNLLSTSTSMGVDTAMGFADDITSPQVGYWSGRFWYYLDNGYSVSQATSSADTDNIANFGYWSQGGMNSHYIQGNSNIIIDPARAGVV